MKPLNYGRVPNPPKARRFIPIEQVGPDDWCTDPFGNYWLRQDEHTACKFIRTVTVHEGRGYPRRYMQLMVRMREHDGLTVDSYHKVGPDFEKFEDAAAAYLLLPQQVYYELTEGED